MCYIFVYVDHKWDMNLYKDMVSAGKYPVLDDFEKHLLPKYSFAVSMATGMKLEQMSVECNTSTPTSPTSVGRICGARV